jgi:ATP-binding cassette subfamily B protein
LRRYVPPRWDFFVIAIASTVVFRVAQLVPPYLLGVALDAFFTERSGSLSIAFVPPRLIPTTIRGQFTFVAGLFIATALITAAASFVQSVAFRWVQQSVLHDLRMDTYNATQRLDMAFFETEATGDVMSILNNDVNQPRNLLSEWLRQVVELGTFLVGLLAIMLALQWQLTLLTMSFVPIMLGLVSVYQRSIESYYDVRRSTVGNLNTHMQNAISGIGTIKSYGTESRESAELQARSHAFWQADWAAAKISGLFYSTQRFITEVASLGIVVIGGWWVLFGPPFVFTMPLTAGTFVTFLFCGRRLVSQSAVVGDLIDTYTDAKASAKRVFGLFNYPTTITDHDDAAPLVAVDGHVEYREVSFTYPDTDSPTLRNVNLEANEGDFIGLVGPTGAGKSTLMTLLPRLYDPDNGRIMIDGTDVSRATLASLREAIGYVRQDPFLFDNTVGDNIAYGTPDASREEVIKPSQRANVHEFVRNLPEGYDTTIGERGVKLSGGQRQRIALARAIVGDPAILILDEATSHVDNETEVLIRNGLEDLIAERTTFVIAHRLSTVREADRIFVIEDGGVVEPMEFER